MRIITRKLHKAFRELDRFEEPRARAFVRVVSSGWRARGFRYGVMAVVAMPMLFGLVILVGWVASLGSRTTLAQDIVHTGIALTLGLALTFLAVMLTRDQMLRWRIRRLIRRRGTCQMCNYSLLGMPVGPDLIVTCPECGDKLKADLAMNELATIADGRQIFAPKGQVDSPAVIAARKRRRKLAVRWLVGTPLCLLVLAGISFGIWRYWIASMARQARADRDFEALAIAHMQNAHSAADMLQDNQWPALVDILKAWRRDNERMVADEVAKAADSLGAGASQSEIEKLFLYEEFDLLLSKPDPTASAEDMREPDKPIPQERRRMLARKLLQHAADKGHLEAFKSIPKMRHVVREIGVPAGGSAAVIQLPELSSFRLLARMNAARMEVALEAGDRAEYLAALEQTLALARILDKQITLIDRLVAIAIEAQIFGRVQAHAGLYPDDAWRSAVATTLRDCQRSVPFSHALSGERLIARDNIAWYFSDADRVQTAMLLGNIPLGQSAGGLPAVRFNRVGTYAENLATIDAITEQAVAASKVARPRRPLARPLGRPTMLADALWEVSTKVINSDDSYLAYSRATQIMLALESARARTGVYPASLAELVASNPTLDINDPCSSNPFGYRVLSPAADSPDQRGYLLWSVGFDGIDNLGKDAVRGQGYNWSTDGTDMIFNQLNP